MTGTELFTIPALISGGTATAVTLGDALFLGGTILSTVGNSSAGKAQQRADNFQAGQMEQQAGQERAASQRAGAEQRRRARLAESRVRALSAASGGGASDPTVTSITGDIAAEGEYRALTALYEGEERARGMEMGAVAKRYEGTTARQAGDIAAATSVFKGSTIFGSGYGGAQSLLEKYG